MKKNRILGFVLTLGIMQNAYTQVVIPHPIPCIAITPVSIDTFPSGISANDCIQVDGETVNFKTDQHYSIRAGEFIQFDPNTVIVPDGSHQFHAYIQREDMDMAWYYPNATPGTVGQYEKLEIGVQFEDTIQQKIENFVKDQVGAKLNPFNPEDVDLYAEFWVYKELPLGGGMAWYGPKRVNGFYYEEFARNADTIHWDTLATDHNFRIRFAPPTTGLYRCKVSANVYGHGIQTVSEFTFESVPSDNKGFVHVGENARYLKVGNEPFFPVGQNLTGPNRRDLTIEWDTASAKAYVYDIFHEQMTELAANGANYFRYIVSPWQTEIEFEHLGNYSNRMTNAWEFDKILDTAKALDLKMHYNMAMHYSFEQPSVYSMTYWDWSAKGDEYSPSPLFPADEVCWRDTDSGYCYRNELEIIEPTDFFSDSTAMVYYKKRLRYMVARWGYSTEIAVMELLSEANNAGSEHIVNYRPGPDLDGDGYPDGGGGCHGLGSEQDSLGQLAALEYPYNDPSFASVLAAWQIEMCRYIKQDLGHYEHPLAVDYTGTPNIDNGDNSYFSEYVDMANYNNYQLAIDKNKQTYKTIEVDLRVGYGLEKPIMNSESGTGKGVYLCDNNATVIQLICLSPFTGLAGVGMSWDAHFNEQDFWHYLGNVNDLMSGIQLDNENWFAGEPMVQNDKCVEVFHIRKGELGENSKMVGAVANRTYNYYTQGDTLPCHFPPVEGEIYDNPIYQVATDYEYEDLNSNKLKIKDLGYNKWYRIDWYNALDGSAFGTTLFTSSILGNGNLVFPGTLTGDATSPILFFKLYPMDDTFLSPIAPNEFETALPQEFQLAEDLNPIEPTPWADSLNSSKTVISISPNPTLGLVNCQVNDEYLDLSWILVNSNGQQLAEDKILSSNFTIDLSVYSSGNYFILIENATDEVVQTLKIIKQ